MHCTAYRNSDRLVFLFVYSSLGCFLSWGSLYCVCSLPFGQQQRSTKILKRDMAALAKSVDRQALTSPAETAIFDSGFKLGYEHAHPKHGNMDAEIDGGYQRGFADSFNDDMKSGTGPEADASFELGFAKGREKGWHKGAMHIASAGDGKGFVKHCDLDHGGAAGSAHGSEGSGKGSGKGSEGSVKGSLKGGNKGNKPWPAKLAHDEMVLLAKLQAAEVRAEEITNNLVEAATELVETKARLENAEQNLEEREDEFLDIRDANLAWEERWGFGHYGFHCEREAVLGSWSAWTRLSSRSRRLKVKMRSCAKGMKFSGEMRASTQHARGKNLTRLQRSRMRRLRSWRPSFGQRTNHNARR